MLEDVTANDPRNLIPFDRSPGFVRGLFFGRSADGMLVAVVVEQAFAMISRSRRRPMSEWIRLDFYGNSGEIADGTTFRPKVRDSTRPPRRADYISGADDV